jgi:hypothetical protein
MVMLTLMIMKRGRTNTVTRIPILIPCDTHEQIRVATFLTEFNMPRPVRPVTDADFSSTSRQREEVENTMSDYEKEQFMAVLALLSALGTKDRLAVARARAKATQALALKREADKKLGIMPAQDNDFDFGHALSPLFGLKPGQEKEAIERWSGYRRGPRAETNEKWLLSQVMSEALDSVRIVLWWSGTRFRPALYCPETKAALYMHFLMKIVPGQGWAVCPKCGWVFEQRRPDQNYCSIAHREAHRVARWRAAKLAKTRKRGGKNVTSKAR